MSPYSSIPPKKDKNIYLSLFVITGIDLGDKIVKNKKNYQFF